MNEEKLKQEAEEITTEWLYSNKTVEEIIYNVLVEREKRIAELEAQVEKMKKELHHRLVSPSHSDSDCLDKIVMLDRLWQFGQEF